LNEDYLSILTYVRIIKHPTRSSTTQLFPTFGCCWGLALGWFTRSTTWSLSHLTSGAAGPSLQSTHGRVSAAGPAKPPGRVHRLTMVQEVDRNHTMRTLFTKSWVLDHLEDKATSRLALVDFDTWSTCIHEVFFTGSFFLPSLSRTGGSFVA
jgi:hypothetical protein